MKPVKCSYIYDDEDEDEEYKRVTVTVEQVDELPSKVKYKTILEEEDDFLPE